MPDAVELQTTPFAPVVLEPLDDLSAARRFPVNPALEPAFVAHGEARHNLDRLLHGALCVTTGQQPGLFTGPLYTVYKGLATVALARALEGRLDRPVVPVFWVAGDDHDLAEANHVHLVTGGHVVDRVVVRDRRPSDPLVPLYREPLGDGLHAAFEALERETPASEFRPGVLEWLRRCYVPERDFATAFTAAMAELLGSQGLVVFQSTHRAAKAAMAPWLLRALADGAALDRALAARARQLQAGGRSAPVPVGDRATTVLCECELGRDRLMLGTDGFVTRRSGHAWSLTDLERLARNEPERLSPNVLLRPVVEAALLPTLAYVAGPGELAYVPQCAPIYEMLDVPPQAAVPRWSGRVVEGRVAKVLEKYGIAPDDLDRPEGQLEAELVREEMPREGREALTALRETVEREYRRLEGAAAAVDPTLKKTVQHARNSAFKDLTHLEKRLVSHLKKENEIVVQQLAKARVNLFPLGKAQERVLNVVPYLIRYGREFLDHARRHAEAYYAPLESGSAPE